MSGNEYIKRGVEFPTTPYQPEEPIPIDAVLKGMRANEVVRSALGRSALDDYVEKPVVSEGVGQSTSIEIYRRLTPMGRIRYMFRNPQEFLLKD